MVRILINTAFWTETFIRGRGLSAGSTYGFQWCSAEYRAELIWGLVLVRGNMAEEVLIVFFPEWHSWLPFKNFSCAGK